MRGLAYTLSPQLSSSENTIFTVQFGPQVQYIFQTRLAAAAPAEQAPTRNVSELLRTESGPDQLAPTNCFHCLKVPAIYPLSSRHLELDTALLRGELLQFGLITSVSQFRYRYTIYNDSLNSSFVIEDVVKSKGLWGRKCFASIRR